MFYSFFLNSSVCSIEARMPFFDFTERLHCRIPAAVGLSCVGFWRRVGGSAMFPAAFFFIFFLSTSYFFVKV
jgi:hypothetical protein